PRARPRWIPGGRAPPRSSSPCERAMSLLLPFLVGSKERPGIEDPPTSPDERRELSGGEAHADLRAVFDLRRREQRPLRPFPIRHGIAPGEHGEGAQRLQARGASRELR